MTTPLTALADAVEALGACDPSEVSGGDDVVLLEQLAGRLEAIVARAVDRFSAEGTYADDGAASATAWLSIRTRRPTKEIKAQLRLARLLQALPAMADGVLSGRVGTAQLRCAGRLLSPRTEAAVRDAEEFLAEQAEVRTYREYEHVVAYLGQHLDPDGCEAAAEERRARRDVWLEPSFEGTYLGRIQLDPIAGAIVANELERLADVAYAEDVAEATARLGRAPDPGDLDRTPFQRRADALVEMARRSAAVDDEARLPAPLVSVLVDFPTLSGRICELANGTVVTPGSLLPYLDKALIERAVWKGPTRVEVGAKTRLFTGATRRAIELRDRVCQHPYCEIPLERCQVDHIIPASEHGPTTQENGRLLCGFHNRLRVRRPDLPDRWGPPGGGPPSDEGPPLRSSA